MTELEVLIQILDTLKTIKAYMGFTYWIVMVAASIYIFKTAKEWKS